MEFVMKKILILCLTVTTTSCFSGAKDDSESLDVQPIEKPVGEKQLSYSDLTKPESQSLPADAVTNWQSFFKPPPSSNERSLLELKLKKWTDTGTAQNLVERGRNESAVSQFAAAELSFRRALRLDDDNHEALLELASLYLKKNEVPTAFDLLSQVREVITTSENITKTFVFKYRYVLALAHLSRGEKDSGHKILSDLIGESKEFAPAYIALASSYIELGRSKVAEFVLKRAVDRIKSDASVFNLMGYIKQRERQMEEARRWYDKALAVNPNYSPALINRGNLFAQQFELGMAEKDLLSALASDPVNSDAMVSLGIVQKRQGNLAGARASLTKAVDIEPNNAYARFNLGVLMAKDFKQPTDALRLFNEVLQTTNASAELTTLARNYMADLQRGQTASD